MHGRETTHYPAPPPALTDGEQEARRIMTAADTQLRQTLLGLPSTIGFVLQVAHTKQLATIVDEADAATHGALERHLLALHAYLREWAAPETTATMRAQITEEVASLLAPFAFSRGFLLQAAQALTAPPRDPSLQLAPEVQAAAVQRVTAARATLAQAVEALVLLHLPFVERFTRGFVAVYRRYGRHLEPTDQLDLYQEGCVGLLRAAWRYNPQHNTRFWTYARHWVHQALGRLVPKLGDGRSAPGARARPAQNDRPDQAPPVDVLRARPRRPRTRPRPGPPAAPGEADRRLAPTLSLDGDADRRG